MNIEEAINSMDPSRFEAAPSTIESVDGKALSSPVTKIDPDTVKVDGKSVRLAGFNAPETAKFQGGIFIPGQVAGDRTQQVVDKVEKAGGFNRLVSTGKTGGYSRELMDQQNAGGDSLGKTLETLGITDPTMYTDVDTIRQHRIARALMRGAPELASADPVMKIAMDEHKQRIEESGGSPLYIPKLAAQNEIQYKAAKEIVGVAAAKEAVDEINRLTKILEDPSLREDTRVKLQAKLEAERDKLWTAAVTPDFVGSVEFRKADRDIMNNAHEQIGTALEKGWINLKQGFYGIGEIVGDSAKWAWLSEKSKNEVARLKMEEGLTPDIINSIRDVPGKDTWSTIENSATYVGNLLAQTLPHMAVLVGATIATAPIGGWGGMALSAVPGSALYVGQFYSNQDEDKKNPVLAISAGIGAGVLDRIGLQGMIAGPNLFSKVGREEVLTAMLASGKYANREAAMEVLENATKKEILDLAGFGAQFAERHFASKEAKMAALKSVGLGTVSESGTEAAQTFLEMMASSGQWDIDQRYEKGFYEAIVDAAIGGGIMGGAFDVGGVALDMASWHSAADAKRAYEKNIADSMAYRADQRQKAARGEFGAVSALDGVQKAIALPANDPIPNLLEMQGRPGKWNGFLSVVKDPLRLVRGLAETTVRDLRKTDGTFKTFLPILKSIMKQGTLTGDHMEGFRQRIIGEWSTTGADELAAEFKTSPTRVEQIVQSAWTNVWSKGERLPSTNPTNVRLQAWMDEVSRVSGSAIGMLKDLGINTEQYERLSSVFEDSMVDPYIIARNASAITSVMIQAGADKQQAAQAVNNLIGGDPALAGPAKEFMKSYGVFSDPKLASLFIPNVFNSFENFKQRIASHASHELYMGRDGSNLARLIYWADKNGEFASEQEKLDVIQNTQDFYKIVTGQYNSLEAYPFIEKVLGWGVTATMLASLGKAAVSSLPESAIAVLGTPGEKVTTQLSDSITNFFKEWKSDFNKGTSIAVARLGLNYAREHPSVKVRQEVVRLQKKLDDVQSKQNPSQKEIDDVKREITKMHRKLIGRNLFDKLGFNDTGYNTQAKFEIASANMKKTMHFFASLIGLRAVTDANRIAALSVAADIIRQRIGVLQAVPPAERALRFETGENLSKDQYYALYELEKYGMDVTRTLEIMDQMLIPDNERVNAVIDAIGTRETEFLRTDESGIKPDAQWLRETMLTTLRNMVDSKIVNPQSGNLPKYYYDPHLRIFTAMTRFIAGLTANILPRLYFDYVKDGNAGMRYQAFAVMASALAMAYIANNLKDILSYGDDENPYVKGKAKEMQRAIEGSGLLGRFDQVLQGISPIYKQRVIDPTEQPVAWAWSTLKGNAPPINWADRTVRGMYNLGIGETELGTKQVVRSLPVAGSFPIVAETVSKQIAGKD